MFCTEDKGQEGWDGGARAGHWERMGTGSQGRGTRPGPEPWGWIPGVPEFRWWETLLLLFCLQGPNLLAGVAGAGAGEPVQRGWGVAPATWRAQQCRVQTVRWGRLRGKKWGVGLGAYPECGCGGFQSASLLE